VKSLSSGSVAAVEAFVARHLAAVRGYLHVLGCPARMLDDLVQDVFLGVLRSGFEERGPAQTAAYLRKVARHLLLKALERERRLPAAGDLEQAEAAWAEFRGTGADEDGAGYLGALRACLAELRDRARRALELRYAERLDRAAIGERLGLSEEGVKSILARAKRGLRACVERRIAS
jgi:RNA polymerase sigma-70 factor (ECF subfamily)